MTRRTRTLYRALIAAAVAVVLVLAYRCSANRGEDPAPESSTPSAGPRSSDGVNSRERLERARRALQPSLARHSLTGRVIDEAGAPMADAEVILAIPARTVRTGADGGFRFDDLTDGSYVVEARADDRYAGPINARVGAVPRPVTLRLYAAGRVAVSCVTAATGAPLSNVRAGVRMLSMFPGAVDLEARTDGNGVATFRGMPAAGLEAWCAAEGYELRARGVNSTQEGAWSVRIELVPGVSVRGRVVDTSGAPVAGATIEIAPSPMPMLAGVRGSVRSDRDGRFTYPGVARGTWVVHADHASHALGTASIDVGDVSPPEITVVVGDGVEVSGVVATRDDAPVPGATIEVRFRDGGRQFRTAQADGTGHFAVKGLPREALLLVARSDGSASPPTAVDTRDGRAITDLLLALVDDQRIRGVVVDAADRPLPDVSVFFVHDVRDDDRATPAGVAVTGEDGHFELAGLRDGASYVLTAMRPGHFAAISLAARSVGMRVRAGDTVTVRFPVNGSLTGKVVLADGGVLPAGTRIQLGGTPQHVAPDGAFRIDDLPPETYVVLAEGPGLLEVRRGGVEVKAGEVTDLGEIRLARGRQVIGTVRDAGGRPVAGADVRFVPVGVPGALVAETDEHGNFSRVLPTDRDCDVMAVSGGLGATEAQHVVAGAKPVSLDLRFARSGRIVGTVRAGGAPASGRTVLLDRQDDGPPSNMETTGTDGGFEFVVAGGTYKISLLETDGMADRFIDRTITVKAGAEVRLDFP